MRKFFFSIVLTVLCVSLYAQDAMKMGQYSVAIGSVTVNGEKIDGYIRTVKSFPVNGNQKALSLWDLQKEFDFIAKDVFDSVADIRPSMFATYDSKKCDGFTYWDINLGTLRFKSLKMQNAAMVGVPSQGFLLVLNVKPGISFYSFYRQPSVDQEPGPYTVTPKDSFNKPVVMFKRDNSEKAQYVGKFNVDKEFADCPDIVSRFKNGDYQRTRTRNDNNSLFKQPTYSFDEPTPKSDAYVNAVEAFCDR